MDQITQYLSGAFSQVSDFLKSLFDTFLTWFMAVIDSIKNSPIWEQIFALGTQYINLIFEYRLFVYVGIACFIVGYLVAKSRKNEK